MSILHYQGFLGCLTAMTPRSVSYSWHFLSFGSAARPSVRRGSWPDGLHPRLPAHHRCDLGLNLHVVSTSVATGLHMPYVGLWVGVVPRGTHVAHTSGGRTIAPLAPRQWSTRPGRWRTCPTTTKSVPSGSTRGMTRPRKEVRHEAILACCTGGAGDGAGIEWSGIGCQSASELPGIGQLELCRSARSPSRGTAGRLRRGGGARRPGGSGPERVLPRSRWLYRRLLRRLGIIIAWRFQWVGRHHFGS